MHKILIVERIHQAGEKLLSEKAELVYPRPQNLEGILAVIGDCDAIVVRNTPITRQIMEAAPGLVVIGRHGVGYDTVDVDAAAELGNQSRLHPGGQYGKRSGDFHRVHALPRSEYHPGARRHAS